MPELMDLGRYLDVLLGDLRPWQICLVAVVFFVTAEWIVRLVWSNSASLKSHFFGYVRKKVPFVGALIDKELSGQLSVWEKSLHKQLKGMKYCKHLPEKGWSKAKVVDEIAQMNQLAEFDADKGGLSGTYLKPGDPEKVDSIITAFNMTAYSNTLIPQAFPGIRKMEAEVVQMTVDMLHGDENACGTMTSGGTEDLILAVKTFRDRGRALFGITRPNLVMPVTAHVALDKAGHLLGVEVRKVRLDPHTMLPDLKEFERKIDLNTVMLVASAPSYPNGLMDPLSELSQLALRYNIPLHVDACLGGFLLPFVVEAGVDEEPPLFDFRLPGVSSISADTHKFGFSPKGTSVIAYRSRDLVHFQYFVFPDWTGGIFASASLAGSRSGGLVAATWAALVAHGRDGYVNTTREIVVTLRDIVSRIRKIPGLRVIGNPRYCIVSFASDDFQIYTLAERMKDKGWLLACMQYPQSVHLYVTPMHVQSGVKDKFLDDLEEASAQLLKEGKTETTGQAAVYGIAQTMPDKGLIKEVVERFVDILYSTSA